MTSSVPPAARASGEVDVSRLRLAIVRMARRQRQHAGTGLTPTLQSALAVIDVRGPLTLGQLAAFEQVVPPSITRIVSKLEEMGLVLRLAERLRNWSSHAVDARAKTHSVSSTYPALGRCGYAAIAAARS